MEKTATLNLRVNPEVKKSAEAVLSQLCIPMSVAIDMYLKQIALKGKIPFEISVPMAPPHLNADLMTKEELIAFINEGLEDVENGNVMPFEDAFSNLREKMVKEYGLDGTV